MSISDVLGAIRATETRDSDFLVVGLGGGECSGKSYLAERARASADDIQVIQLDGYLRHSREQRKATYKLDADRLSDRANYIGDSLEAFDLSSLQNDISALRRGKQITTRTYERDSGEVKFGEPMEVENGVLLIEGLYAIHRDLQIDVRMFMRAPGSVVREQYFRRHKELGEEPEKIRRTYELTLVPAYLEYIAPLSRDADYIVHNDFTDRWELREKRVGRYDFEASKPPSDSTQPTCKVYVSRPRDRALVSDGSLENAAASSSVETVIADGRVRDRIGQSVGDIRSAESVLAISRGNDDDVFREVATARAFEVPCYVAGDDTALAQLEELATWREEVRDWSEPNMTDLCERAFKTIQAEILERRRTLAPRLHAGIGLEKISWQDYDDAASRAVDWVRDLESFNPNLVVGIAGGGLIAGDYIAKKLDGRRIGCVQFRKTRDEDYYFDAEPLRTILKRHCYWQSTHDEPVQILLVDDVIKSGRSLFGALSTIEWLLSSLKPELSRRYQLRSLVLFSSGRNDQWIAPPEIIRELPSNKSLLLPYGRG